MQRSAMRELAFKLVYEMEVQKEMRMILTMRYLFSMNYLSAIPFHFLCKQYIK